MSRYHSHINTSLRLIRSYRGEIPFPVFIKKFFSQEKKIGSGDRKQIASICYSYFRVALAFKKQLTEENLLSAFFLFHTGDAPLISALRPAWTGALNAPIAEKLGILDKKVSLTDIFPYVPELNDDIGVALFCQSFLLQPSLFVRIRPSFKKQAAEKIIHAGIEHEFLNQGNSVRFAPATNIETFLTPDKEVVVQDLCSQQVLNYIVTHRASITQQFPPPVAVWDCCAASGGKSILLADLLQQKIKLTVSDIRKSTLAHLQQRFKNASIKNYHHFAADISDPTQQLPSEKYDLIICDAPCTGSGTWSRTPEQLYFFDPSAIDLYAAKQKKIAVNVLQQLKKDGLFFYITCSVFKKENEGVVEHILQQPGITLLEKQALYGYAAKADSMFVAVFRKTR
jgi:16S rRNA (cytosine967-C5)-methyltransferase